MIRRLCLLLAIPLAPAGALAQGEAQPKTPAEIAARNAEIERLHGEAVAHFQAKRYREALTQFEAAHALLADPTLTYNIGRCHQALGDLPAARTAYQAVADDTAADATLRARAAKRAATVEAALAQAPPLAPPVEVVTAGPPTPPDHTLEWGLLGGGAAAFIAGTVLVFLGGADHAELEGSVFEGRGDITRADAEALDESGRTKQIVGGTLMGLGLAAAGVGAYRLFFADAPSDAPAVGPTVTPDAAGPGVLLRWEF